MYLYLRIFTCILSVCVFTHHVCAYPDVHLHTQIIRTYGTYIHTYMHTYVHDRQTCVHTCAHTHIYTHMHADTHTCIHPSIAHKHVRNVYTHTYIKYNITEHAYTCIALRCTTRPYTHDTPLHCTYCIALHYIIYKCAYICICIYVHIRTYLYI